MWNVGNESMLGLQNCYSGTELEQRNAYATFVNEQRRDPPVDPNHPVTSTDAWTGAWPYYKRNAPDLDLYAVNSYNAVCDIKATWEQGGYNKPYIVTEAGPAGEWEVPDDANGVPEEPTDREGRGVHQRLELHHRPQGRRARRHDVPLRQRGRLRRHLVQPAARATKAPAYYAVRRPTGRTPPARTPRPPSPA